MNNPQSSENRPPTDKTIGFIGGGNMASAMLGGMLQSGFPAARLFVSEPDSNRRALLGEQLPGIQIADSNADAARCDVCILAVKPQILAEVCRSLDGSANGNLFVSIAAGVRSHDIERWLGIGTAVVRAMPNQGALVGRSATGVFANSHCSRAQRELAGYALASVGRVMWFDNEADIDSVTAIAGSGPAYFFLLMELMHNAARSFGLDDETSSTLVTETAAAAAMLAERPGSELTALRASVTSKGGTTAAAIDTLLANNIDQIFSDALQAARTRAAVLADNAANQ